jgi:putative ABC transport system permease protein
MQWQPGMSSLWADLRFALRMMAKTPGFTTVLVLTLALGIGASTTIFSIVNSVVLQPLPYKDPERLVRIYTEFHSPDGMKLEKFAVSVPEYIDLRRGCTSSCEMVSAMAIGTASIAGGDRPIRVDAAWGHDTMLPIMGVEPLLGRWWTPEEDVPNADPTVIVLGYDVWKRAFAGDPDVIGRKVTVDAMPVTVIGVMPRGFDYPGGIEAWAPYGIDPASIRRGGHGYHVLVRLAPGATIETLRAEIGALTAAWSAGKTPGQSEHHINATQHTMIAMPLHQEVVGSLSTILWLLQGAVLFVLLIAIANITNLLLARAETRSREVAVRHALGATRGRLVRQLITESVALGVIGGGLGILVAVWALDAAIAVIPQTAPRLSEIGLDGNALLFALALTLVSSLLFGLAPILHTRRADVHSALKEGGPRTTGSKARLRVRRALVVAEIALAVVLVIGCGLMVKSFLRLQQVDLGFRPGGVLAMEVELPAKTYDTHDKTNAFWRRLEERVRALPGVRRASILGGLPPERQGNFNDLGLIGGKADAEMRTANVAYWQFVTAEAFDTLGARIIRGRPIDERDVAGAPAVVVINEAFAARFFPGEDPIGKLIDVTPWDKHESAARFGIDQPGPDQTVVGLVADIKNAGVAVASDTEVFIPLYQMQDIAQDKPWPTMRLLARTDGDPEALIPPISRIIGELDPSLPLSKIRTLDEAVWHAIAKPRFLTFLLGSFATLALLLAGIGIYGVMAYTIAQRTHEIGIRVALGAEPRQVRAMVLRQAAVLGVIGVALGLLGAIAVEMALETTLASATYGEELRDPLLFGAVVVAVLGTALLATWLPALRATRVEPTVALRAE